MFQLDSTKFYAAPVANDGAAPAVDQFQLWLGRIWRAKYWMLVCGIIGVASAFAFNVLVKPSYEASAMVYVDPQDLQILPDDISARAPSGDSGAMFVESQARIMQSAEVFRDVVVKLGLQADREFASKVTGTDGSGDMALQGTIDNLASAVRIVHADRTYVIEIYARSEDPKKAAVIANAIVDSYLSIREIQRAKTAAVSAAAIENRLAELRQDLSAAEHAADQFKVAHGIVASNGQTLIEGRLNSANGAVSAALLAMNEAKTRLSQLDSAGGDALLLLSSPEALSSPDLQRLRGEYENALATLQSETATQGPKHPTVIRAQAQVNAVSKSISTTANRLRSAAKLQYDNAAADYDAANRALAALTVEFQTSDSALVQLRLLEQDVASSKAVYDDALLRSRQTREQEQINTANVQVISPATAPILKRFPPKLSVLIPLALAMGLALGAAIGVLLQMRRPAPPRKVAAATDAVKPAPIRPVRPVQTSGLRRLAALRDKEPVGNA